MNKLKQRFAEYLIRIKTRPVARRVNQSLTFPIKANMVKKVLVILPRNLELLDRASNFVQSLRKTYPAWQIEMFDVDKLGEKDLNHMQLPRSELIQRLKNAGYHFVLDLNTHYDQLASYIALMTEAPYRLHLQSESSLYYNIVYHPNDSQHPIYYEPLLNYLRKLFVRV